MTTVTLLAPLAALAVVHELGHAAAAQLLGLPWRPVVSKRGPGIRVGRDDLRLTRAQRGITAAAGPGASLLLAACLWAIGQHLCALASIEIAVVNLVPFRHSDGMTLREAIRG